MKLDGLASFFVGLEARADVGRGEEHSTTQALQPAVRVAVALLLGEHWCEEATPVGTFCFQGLGFRQDFLGGK